MIPGIAPSKCMSSGATHPQRILFTWFCPPIVFAEPCRLFTAVTPPASWRYHEMLSGSVTSPMRTSLVTLCPPSFTPLLMPVWLWQSTIPGATCLPVASISTGGSLSRTRESQSLIAASSPTAAIFPPEITTPAPCSVPASPSVQTVALRMMNVPCLGSCSKP